MASYPLPQTSEPPEPVEHRAPKREEQARALCLRLLTGRARTRAELAGQLAKRGYPDEVSTTVLDRLTAAGLVDDVDFTEQWVRSRRARAGKGRRVLATELRAKGIAEDVIAEVLSDIGADAERDRAGELVRGRLRRETLDGPDDVDIRVARRLVAMLVRRGYDLTLAYSVVSTELVAERERRRV